MGLYQLLEPSERTAIIEPNGRVSSFADLHRESGRLGGYFHRQLGVGGRVLLMQPVGIDLYNVVVGLFAAGATGVLVDPSAGYRRVRETLQRIGVRGVVGPWWAQALRLVFPELRGGSAYLGGLGATSYARAVGGPLPQRFDEDTPALITFTTGSTGRPKAVARSHAFLVAQHRVLSQHLGLGPGDVDLATLPVFALSSLASGATVVFPDSNLRKPASVDPGRVLPQMRAQGVSHVTASPAFLAPLARELLKHGDTYQNLRGCFTGGARVSASLGRDLCIAFPRARVEVVYGSTEAEPIAALDVRASIEAMEVGEREGLGALVGTPVPEIEVRVVRPGTLDAADVGEIVVSGPHVNRRYWDDPEADAANKIAEGHVVWHRTGDTGRLDAQGRLWLVGRVADMVGELHPFPLEIRAERVPGVHRAALVDAGGPVLAYEGDEATAELRRATGIDRVLRVDRVPVDPRHNAKIDRAKLRAMIGSPR